jgi:hypothetical protein
MPSLNGETVRALRAMQRAKPATSKIISLRRIANPGQPDANCGILEMKSHRIYDGYARAPETGNRCGSPALGPAGLPTPIIESINTRALSASQ